MPEAKDVRIGEYIIFNREPYKLKRKEIVTAGTHMHSKLKFIMQGLFSTGEKTSVFGHHDKVDLAELEMKSGQVISVVGSKCQIMDSRSYEVVDVEVNPDVPVQEGSNVIFVLYNGRNILMGEAK